MQHRSLPQPRLFLTGDYPCNYLPDRQARNLVVDPDSVDQPLYQQIIRLGFRRSGDHVYRPHCAACQACQSLRIDVAAFRTDRSQRRVWKRNQDLRLTIRRFDDDPEHYRLFSRYVRHRHPDGGMDQTSPEAYRSFLTSRWCDTRLWEFRHGQSLLCAAVVDHLDDALSAVYTYYRPQASDRGLGTYAILRQIAEASRRGLSWVYLGYQIDGCARMAYKARFRPHQRFRDGRWRASPD